MTADGIKPGTVLLIDGRASVQFGGDRALVLRVISVSERPTYHGWAWVTGYVLDGAGQALDRREVFVQVAGLRPVSVRPANVVRRNRGV
ncbi:hypothetical protein EDC02_3999 [Micromonospora sp. Llam0]|nr:hypothetical protein EDC02_3999 [Micromonospora sp. Llam0]